MSRPKHGFDLDPSKPWRVEAGSYFKRGGNNKLTWPARVNMVSEKHRVLFTPIAKCACTSLKTMMVTLAQVPSAEHILRMGVHRITDEFNTGMHLKDLPYAKAVAITNSDDYYKFTVIRDPLKRIISAYTDKFLTGRLSKANQLHSKQVIRVVQDSSNPDMERGISFREFVQFLISQSPATLDPHWMPQHFSLTSVAQYSRVYRVDQLSELKQALEDWTGTDIELGKLNTSIASASSENRSSLAPEQVVDLLPGELEALGELSSAMFMETELVSALEHYYEADFALYQSTFEPGNSYRLSSTDIKPAGQPAGVFPTSPKATIWNRVQIYSKGFFGLQPDGHGSTRVAVVNGNNTAVDSESFPSLRLESRIFDQKGKPLNLEPTIHPLDTAVAAGSALQLNLELAVPTDSLSQASTVQITLVATSDDGDIQNGLAHVASAQIMQLQQDE